MITREDLLKRLKELELGSNYWYKSVRHLRPGGWPEPPPEAISPSDAHEEADKLLLEYIKDPEITEAFNAVDKWYD